MGSVEINQVSGRTLNSRLDQYLVCIVFRQPIKYKQILAEGENTELPPMYEAFKNEHMIIAKFVGNLTGKTVVFRAVSPFAYNPED